MGRPYKDLTGQQFSRLTVLKDVGRSKRRAYITANKKRIELGHFVKFEDAVQARRNAENLYHNEFSLLNSITDGGQINV